MTCFGSFFPKFDTNDNEWTCGSESSADCIGVGQYFNSSKSGCQTDTASLPECGENKAVELHYDRGYICVDKPKPEEPDLKCPKWASEKDGACTGSECEYPKFPAYDADK